MEELYYKIWFSKLDITNKNKLKLLEKYKNCENIWKLNKLELKENFEDKTIDKIIENTTRTNLEKELNYILKNNIKLITKYDEEFPQKLLQIPDCPSQIYVRGDTNKLYEDNIGIVGSRNASEYGKIVASQMGKDFAKYGINVVSGLAIGIDKFSHLGALECKGGKTIAVLGNGVCEKNLYPLENLRLYERILDEGGAIVSEYPPFENPKPYYFPARNRIISGLSNKIIVVEAKEKSGSLITVEFALEQGKDVFAVPGDITKLNSKGTNKLIQDGALPFLTIKDCFI